MKMCGSAVYGWAVVMLYFLAVHGQPVKTAQESPGVEAPCRRTEIPANRPRGSNRLSNDNWDPVYKLSVLNDGQEEYTVSVQLGSRVLPFSDAFVSAETNGSCGVGQFHYNTSDFYRVVQPQMDCPLLLISNRKSAMQRLPPLRWKTPPCGCVHFRAMVIEASTVYYAEPANKAEGPLAVTICSPLTGQHPRKELTIEERTELLCQLTERYSGLSVIQRPLFLHNRRLQPRNVDTHAFDLALSARRHDIRTCCVKKGEERRECLTNIRRRRVDGFCEDGVPDLPFTVLRASFMRQREESCCWRLAEDRYSCFNTDSELKTGQGSADYSLDETDPLNDLADYDEELRSLEKETGTTLIARVVTESPLLFSSSTTPPTTASTTTTTTTTTTSPPFPPLQSPRRPSPFPPPQPPSGQRVRPLGQGMEREGKDHRRVGMAAGGGLGYGDVDDPSLVSRAVGEQQGGSSIEKTFAGLKRRMWKLTLKTRCCRNGMHAARAAYGDFKAVWSQCQHSSKKFLAGQNLRHGHKLCSSQFHRCCMEMAVSFPSEVVTMAPDSASSREWDRDSHLVHSLYHPPHSRTLPHPDQTSRRSHPKDILPSRGIPGPGRPRGPLSPTRSPIPARSLAIRKSLLVDEPEIGEEPEIKRPKAPKRPHFRQRGGTRTREVVTVLDEDFIPRRQRRLRKLNSRERRKFSRRSRERLDKGRASRREMDDHDLEEGPLFHRKPRRRQNSGGRSKERRNRQGQMRGGNPPSLLQQAQKEVIHKEDMAETTQPSAQGGTTVSPSMAKKENAGAQPEAKRLELIRQLEEEQLKNLFAQIAEDVEDEEESSIDKEVDDGSEENAESLGLPELGNGDVDDDDEGDSDDDDDDDDDEEYEDENEELVKETDSEEIYKNVGSSEKAQEKSETAHQDSEHKPLEQPAEEIESQPSQRSSQKKNVEHEEPAESLRKPAHRETSPVPRPRASEETLHTSTRRRNRHRLRSRGGLSEEEGHGRSSGGRSDRRKRKHLQGRKGMMYLRHHKRRLRDRERRRELSEALEEE